MFTKSNRYRNLKRIAALVLSVILVLPELSMGQVLASETQPESAASSETYVLDATADLVAVAQGAKADGDVEKAGTNDFFTIYYSAKTKIDGSSKTFDDGYSATQRISFGGKTDLSVPKNAIQFTTEGSATVKVWWVSGDAGRPVAILDNAGNVVDEVTDSGAKNDLFISNFEIPEAGTYYLANTVNNNYFFKVEVTVEKTVVVTENTYVLDTTADLVAVAQGAKADGEIEKAGTEEFFSVIYSAKTKVDGSSKTFEDGYSATQRISFGGKTDLSVPKNAIQFTTDGSATVKVWGAFGDVNRPVAILDGAGNVVSQMTEGGEKNAPFIANAEIPEAGTYYLANTVNNNYFFKVEVTVTSGGSPVKPPRADWSTVAAPVITDAKAKDNTSIDVTVSANVGYDGADEVVVKMYDAAGQEIASKRSIAEKTEHTLTFTPSASGTYTFKATASREGVEDKVSAANKDYAFVLPLGTPPVSSATCNGSGKITIKWDLVDEAESYIVSAKGTDISKTVAGTETEAMLEGLEVGKTYTFSVVAVRGADQSAEGTIDWLITSEAQREWAFAAYGSSTNTVNNKATGTVFDNNLVVESMGGKGKLVPASTDGLAFYYTTIDQATENFTLSADITVEEWTFSNGQEGFGMMAADTVGINGDSTAFWTNSYMNSVTKVEYFWDAATGTASDNGTKYSMKLGIGAQEKKGVTKDNLPLFSANDSTTISECFSSHMYPLECSAAQENMGAGTYNIVGNYTKTPGGDMPELLTTFHMEIQRNNTGYFLTYTDEEGNSVTKKFYHGDDGDELTKIDADHIYVGFFASRNARISVKNVVLTTIRPEEDAPAEGRPVDKVTPNYTVESAKIANTASYELVYYGNADGKLLITDEAGKTVLNKDVLALTKVRVPVTLVKGMNNFTVTFTPNPDYKPSQYEVMENYDAVTFNFGVEYKVSEKANVYISPNGSANGDGTKDKPVDIYTAVKYAAPGQKLFLMEGTYNLSSTVLVERGIDGTAEKLIYLAADPEAAIRPVLNFNKAYAGMVIAGDYWYLQGFDVTGSAPGQKGIQISGNHNTLDDICTYRNGNTGIQISRYKGTDTWEDWPSDNLVLNCTSYLNADPGYEDADGFAAKLTIADGNVFDGCISAYNADDGWDLYAKVETGSIGSVTIRNCVAFKNGYDLDASGNEIVAGNGNGFKMGGESLSGYHKLENSIAFANRAKGIDSNSCPDIQVKNSVSYNNESYNVAFYTNNAANTDFSAQGIISFKDNNAVGEQFKYKGTQDTAKIFGTGNYYFPDGNSAGVKAEASWFTSLDVAAAIRGGITRNADNTINMNGFLVLTDTAPADAGARMTGTPSKIIEGNAESGESGGSSEGGNTGGGSGSGDGGSTGTDSGSSTTPPVVPQPEVDWTEVDEKVDDTERDNVDVEVGDHVTVPDTTIESLFGTDTTLALHVGNGITFSISGQDVNQNTGKLQLSMEHNDTIPENAKTEILVDAVDYKAFAVETNADFGAKMNVHMALGAENSGMYANLYRYDEETGKMDYESSYKINKYGQAMFAFPGSGEYVVTITKKVSIIGSDNYVVTAGDTLSKIASKYGIKLGKLLKANPQIKNPNRIRVGQVITIKK